MTDITIPFEAVEAAATALALAENSGSDELWPLHRQRAAAALRAGIAAWPGMAVNDGCPVWHAYPHTILPLPQEPRDD